MKYFLRYTSILIFLLQITVSNATAQGSGFIDPQSSRYKWDISGAINPPLTGIEAVYPNPNHDLIDILLVDKAYQPVDVWVLNMDGTVLKTFHFRPQGKLMTIDVGFLSAGEYVLQVKEAGKELQRMRLIRNE